MLLCREMRMAQQESLHGDEGVCVIEFAGGEPVQGFAIAETVHGDVFAFGGNTAVSDGLAAVDFGEVEVNPPGATAGLPK